MSSWAKPWEIRKHLDKGDSGFKHARRRAKQRYGINLTPDVHRDIVDSIKCGQAQFVARQSLTRTVWKVVVQQPLAMKQGVLLIPAIVIYDKKRSQLLTFLPPDITNVKGVPVSL